MNAAPLTKSTAVLSLEPSGSGAAKSIPATTSKATTESADLNVNASTSSYTAHLLTNPSICRYFQRGVCRFGSMCRFSHDLRGGEIISSNTSANNSATSTERPSTNRHNWANANAPVFIPKADHSGGEIVKNGRSWADVVGATASRVGVNNVGSAVALNEPGSINDICPFEGACPYGIYCAYAIHLELCEMCDQFCLHPVDEAQRKKHKKECLQQHEQAMELSFAIARSKDKTCGICFDTIMEKASREKRFGILPNCNHIFCLECIRKWRQAKQFEHKITRSCPECRVTSDFICPSVFWVETKEEKDKLLGDYRKALGIKDCKYFKMGNGKCPFGNKCFYKHALPSGELVDVGVPKKGRKMLRSNNEIINLLDIYLYEFLDQRDISFHDIASTSDVSDDDFDDDDVFDDNDYLF